MAGLYDRQKRYKQKKYLDDPEYRKKESERINKLIWKRNSLMTEEEKEEKKQSHKEYMKNWRLKKKLESSEKIRIGSAAESAGSALSPKSTLKRKTGFRTKPALRRAVRKLLDRAPASPSKRQGVVSEMAKECGLIVTPPPVPSLQSESPSTSNPKALSADTVSKVRDFFYQTNIVYTTPGQKDEMAIWEGGKKIKLRKFYLELTVKEAFALFMEQYPNVKVGLSKFFELKPKNVLHMSKAPNDQCKCITHENFRLMLKPLKVEVNIKFWDTVLCNSSDLNSSCWKGDCNNCQGGILLMNIIDQKELNNEDQVSWHIWELCNTTTKKGKVVKRVVKVYKEGCAGEQKELVQGAWGHYLEHVRIKRIMSKEFQDDLIKENVIILQVDFAMDYNTKDNSREVQSSIYARQNVTIFTAAIRHKGVWKSYSIVTNSGKYKNSVRVFMLRILEDFVSKTDITTIDKLIVWSDGPSCEFRNQFCTGKVLFEMSQVVKKVSYWKYFAASHGKGVCDGIGGSLKARVAEHCRGKHRDDVVVQNHEQFYKLATKYCPKVKIFVIQKEEVEETTDKDQPWVDVQPISGISTLHIAKCGLDGSIQGWKLPGEGKRTPVKYTLPTHTSPEPDIEEPQAEPREIPLLELVIGEWYVVKFEDNTTTMNYLCQLIRVEGDDYVVQSFLSVSGKRPKKVSAKLLFTKYRGPKEIVSQEQFLVQVEKPEMLTGGKVQLKNALGLSVK